MYIVIIASLLASAAGMLELERRVGPIPRWEPRRLAFGTMLAISVAAAPLLILLGSSDNNAAEPTELPLASLGILGLGFLPFLIVGPLHPNVRVPNVRTTLTVLTIPFAPFAPLLFGVANVAVPRLTLGEHLALAVVYVVWLAVLSPARSVPISNVGRGLAAASLFVLLPLFGSFTADRVEFGGWITAGLVSGITLLVVDQLLSSAPRLANLLRRGLLLSLGVLIAYLAFDTLGNAATCEDDDCLIIPAWLFLPMVAIIAVTPAAFFLAISEERDHERPAEAGRYE